MVGPSRAPPVQSPSVQPQARRTFGSHNPSGLIKWVVESSRKYDVPLNYLETRFKEFEKAEEADPYKNLRRRPEDDVRVGDGTSEDAQNGDGTEEDAHNGNRTEEAREARRTAKVNKRQAVAVDSGQESEDETGQPRVKRSSLITDTPSSSLFIPETKASDVCQALELPAWYKKIKTTDRGLKELKKRPSTLQNQAKVALASMRGCMDRCESKCSSKKLAEYFEELRDHIHKAEITIKVDRFVVRNARMLENDLGLPRIFAQTSKADYPWDLRADAKQLYNRWRDEIFEIKLLRGINVKKGTERNADSIEPSWRGKYSAKFYGDDNLVPGQWWPTQLTTVRDGAHGSAQGGIFGEKGKGAYSIVISGGGKHEDEDNGDEIWYCGTDGKDFATTESTLRMIESCDLAHNKVRVLRSSQLPKNNPFRPELGLRYDGLYEVMEKILTDTEKQSYKFRLQRCAGQRPIRYEDNAARRPTTYEIKAYQKMRGIIEG